MRQKICYLLSFTVFILSSHQVEAGPLAVKKIIKDARKKKKNPKLTDLYKKMKKKKNVYQTIVINKPGTYDFKGVLHVWKGKDGQCKQKENRSQILRIEASNVRIKNFFYRGDGKGCLLYTSPSPRDNR